MIRARSIRKGPSLKRVCERLWSDCVCLRAGGKSELTPWVKGEVAHHIRQKPNFRLRYELENGMWITNAQHTPAVFDPHCYDARIRELRGPDIFDRLDKLKHQWCKTDLRAVKLYLETELRKLKAVEITGISCSGPLKNVVIKYAE